MTGDAWNPNRMVMAGGWRQFATLNTKSWGSSYIIYIIVKLANLMFLYVFVGFVGGPLTNTVMGTYNPRVARVGASSDTQADRESIFSR